MLPIDATNHICELHKGAERIYFVSLFFHLDCRDTEYVHSLPLLCWDKGHHPHMSLKFHSNCDLIK